MRSEKSTTPPLLQRYYFWAIKALHLTFVFHIYVEKYYGSSASM